MATEVDLKIRSSVEIDATKIGDENFGKIGTSKLAGGGPSSAKDGNEKIGAANLRRGATARDFYEKVGAENLRCVALRKTGDEWLDLRRESEVQMHLEVYTSGSSNVDRVMGRAALLRNMFQDMACLRIDVNRLTDWDAALWTRAKMCGPCYGRF